MCSSDLTYDEGDAFYLDAQEGHLLCASCAAKAGKNCNLDKAALFALRHICLGGTIGGLPRIMDMGQCNDAYGAIKVAIALAEAFECDVNELPLSMVLSWYEQKAVCILLTLLYLGIKNVHLGPTLPAFISSNVLNFLVENYGISPISTPEEDLKKLLNK